MYTSVRTLHGPDLRLRLDLSGPCLTGAWRVDPLTFSTDPEYDVLQEIMTETGF